MVPPPFFDSINSDGKKYDLLGLLEIQIAPLFAPCEIYLSSQVPRPENQWSAPNSPGYANADYDAACQAALDTLHGTHTYAYYHSEAQVVFSRDLPVLPLYFVPRLIAVRPHVRGIAPDPSEYLTWNIEQVDVAE